MLHQVEMKTPHQFLHWAWKRKQKGPSKIGLRSWAKLMGMKTHTPLSLMLAGKRPIPKKYLPKIGNILELSPKEMLYLELLIDYKGCKDHELKEMYQNRIQLILGEKDPLTMREFENYRYLSDPIHALLLELSALKGFKFDSTWIKQKLSVEYKEEEIVAAIDRLLSLELAQIDSLGRLIKTQKHLTCRPDVTSEGVQNYHCATLDWAKEAVRSQSVHEREFAGYSLNIKKERLPQAKNLIRDFIGHFIKEVEAEEYRGESTYQLGLQFFRLTKD